MPADQPRIGPGGPHRPARMVPNPIPQPEEETLSTLPPIPPDSSPDPDLIARRVSLTRQLLTGAIDRYKQSRSFREEVEDDMPVDDDGLRATDGSPDEESRAWGRLALGAQADHDAAENALAILIHKLSDDLAPEDRRPGPTDVGSGFREKAVSIDGRLYVLVDNPDSSEEGMTLIAMLSNDRVLDLDA
jgi:hypothetical protein